MSTRVLIVDDELDIQSSLSLALEDEGYEIVTATLPKEAEEILQTQDFDLAIYDVWFPEGDGLELLKHTKLNYPELCCVMMSGHGNIELALKSIRMGAYDFLEKPLELDKVLVVMRNAGETLQLKKENLRLNQQLGGRTKIIGKSQKIQELLESTQKAAKANSSVLILGENGSGKELVARRLHGQSKLSREAFVAVNCAAIPENLFESEFFGHEKGAFTGASHKRIGKFEQAGAGMLFLDEISELSPASQGKLLRVLEEKNFTRIGGQQELTNKAWVVAASNRDLKQDVQEGRFREDLYYRLNVVQLKVPSLRERLEDIPMLLEYFLQSICVDLGRTVPHVSPALSKWMKDYDWPGNVREFRNMIERMLIMNPEKDLLDVGDLPEEMVVPVDVHEEEAQIKVTDVPDKSLRALRGQFEKSILEQRLQGHDGNVTKTAESLQLERAHLHRKLKQYGIQREKEIV